MNKVLVKIYLPIIEEQYDIWLPLNRIVYNIIELILKGVNELRGEEYLVEDFPILYNKLNGIHYDLNSLIIDTDIRNGSELILI